jgi:hypothetical protein
VRCLPSMASHLKANDAPHSADTGTCRNLKAAR